MFFRKKLIFLSLFILAAFFGYNVLAFFSSSEELDFASSKKIIINDNGLFFETETSANTVADLLKEKNIHFGDHDLIIPDKEAAIFPGTNISIKRALKIKISADGQTKEFYTLADNVRQAIMDSRVNLGEDDLVVPLFSSPLKNDLKIIITRVKVEEQIVKKDIAYKTIAEEDSDLGWRVKKIKQKGGKGVEEIKYKVVSHDGKEISRKILEKNTITEPTPEVIVQGTYVKTGKAHTGLGTWYAWKGGLFAANPWLPIGSYVRVTNKANGKSVIVQINDRGPFGKNRIIDLDKVAFAQIASIGAGVIDVKMEEILN